MTKIEKVEAISSIETLQTILITLLKGGGFSEIHIDGSLISASIDIPALGRISTLFVLTNDRLSRDYDSIRDLKDMVSTCIKKNSYNSITVVASKNITSGFQTLFSQNFPGIKIEYWDREILIEKIDMSYPDYWRHDDQELLSYEKKFTLEINSDWGIKKIKQFREAHLKLLEIFIEPRLLRKVADGESTKKAYERISVEGLRNIKVPVILEGEPGCGKTRLLKQLGLNFFNANEKKEGKYYLPIFINNIDLIETRRREADKINIEKAIAKRLTDHYSETLAALSQRYEVVLLIDSIDEFDEENQAKVAKDLRSLVDMGVKIIMGTRYQDFSLINGTDKLTKVEEVYIEKFNDHQIKHFLKGYFTKHDDRANNLLASLKENQII